MDKTKLKKKITQYLFIGLGVLLLDFGFYFFIEPAKIVLGGMMGLAIILEPYYSTIGEWFTSSIFLFIANGIALVVGGILLGKDFFFKTIFASIFSPLVVFLFEKTCDPNFFMKTVSEGGYYLVALICGSSIQGVGLGIALKHNGSTGGLDIIQKIMSKYLHIPYSKTMYLTDMVIVLASGLSFSSGFAYEIEMVLYGLVGVFAVSLIVDTIVLNAKMRRTAYIITDNPDAIKNVIYQTIGRGVTFVDVIGGYTKEHKTMIICTMEKDEAFRITELLQSVDSNAFCYVSSTREIVGEYDQ